ncbi:MAG: hypothetical protein PHI47_01910 [Sulfuricurvum sp.]|uniref:hypothetical protein n=1 Tax=Sulfuricurvum sp. TaxID=2025608 RepID=UPI00260553DE|nr:hypothetical protein [Sulfuricurvum sp.]MDD5158779.1 hypothetical protein [Sulfuricurvum sp.]
MKKYTLLILAFAISAFANDQELRLSVNTMSMDYTEFNFDGSFADSEKTNALAGLSLNYSTQISDGIFSDGGYFDVDLSLYQGNTRYDGFYLDSNGNITGPANNKTTKNIITDSSIGYSEAKRLSNALWVTRLGIGYRFWERALEGGHTEDYAWSYGSLSTGISGNLFTNDNIGISVEYHRAFTPKMESNQFGVFDLGRTDGYSITVPWVHTISPSWAFKFTYMYQTWNIEHSSIHSDNRYEPRSESNFNIFNAGLVYCY